MRMLQSQLTCNFEGPFGLRGASPMRTALILLTLALASCHLCIRQGSLAHPPPACPGTTKDHMDPWPGNVIEHKTKGDSR
jgi:hypothetical protein